MENTGVLALLLLRSFSHANKEIFLPYGQQKISWLVVYHLRRGISKINTDKYNAFSAGNHYSTCGNAPIIV